MFASRNFFDTVLLRRWIVFDASLSVLIGPRKQAQCVIKAVSHCTELDANANFHAVCRQPKCATKECHTFSFASSILAGRRDNLALGTEQMRNTRSLDTRCHLRFLIASPGCGDWTARQAGFSPECVRVRSCSLHASSLIVVFIQISGD